LPLSSPVCFSRVVTETVYQTFNFSASAREIVLLPTPEGPTRTMRMPGCFAVSARVLLDVLNLFLQPIDRALDLDDVPRRSRVVGLARDRVGLAEHLLRDEVELAARVFALAARVLERLEVMRQPLDLLGDVGALGEDGDFA
jgi:hypothetical protein